MGPFATSNQQRMLVLWAIWGMVERGGSILPASALKASRAGYRVSMRTIVSSQPFQRFRQISIFMHLAKTYLARSQIWQGSVYAAPLRSPVRSSSLHTREATGYGVGRASVRSL
jgi:hypothetical protein